MRSLYHMCQRILSSRSRNATIKGGTSIVSRAYCSAGDGSKVQIFDRHFKRRQRDRAAWLMHPNDPFVDAVAENLLDRLEDCRKTFPTALCLGGSLEATRRLLCGRGSIEKLIMMDTSYDMVKLCKNAQQDVTDNMETSFVVGDEEFIPMKESSLDLVISCLGLHWTNDLPGAMIQVIYMTGWKEHHSQQKAKRRGSATISFKDFQKQFGSGN